MKFNKEQIDIFEAIEHDKSSLVVEARAGTGKTTTGVEACNRVPLAARTAYVAFNKAIADELAWKVGSNVKASTSHSMGLRSLRYEFPGLIVDTDKTRNLYRELAFPWEHETSTRKLVSYAKTFATANPDFNAIVDYYDVNIDADQIEQVIEFAHQLLKLSNERPAIVDFDDMVYLPAIGISRPFQYDYLFVDEAQDTNDAQIGLFHRSIKNTGRLIAIGDRNQSIYGFRGADVDAIPRIIAEFKAKRLPLSTCYRCGSSIIALAKKIVPDIEAAPNAIEGVISSIWQDNLYSSAKPGDLVLCRVNADLVATALGFIARGIKAQVVGRDIGTSLNSLIEKIEKRYKPNTIEEFIFALNSYTRIEIDKLMRMEKETMAARLQDKTDTLYVICTRSNSISEVKRLIKDIFSDNVVGVKCSSVHRAKGTEADNVFIIRPDLMPHPSARGWQMQQEMNLKYVAITRARKSLTWVHEP